MENDFCQPSESELPRWYLSICSEILTNVINDLAEDKTSLEFKEARRWLESEEESYLFSFRYILRTILGIDYRKGLELVYKRVQERKEYMNRLRDNRSKRVDKIFDYISETLKKYGHNIEILKIDGRVVSKDPRYQQLIDILETKRLRPTQSAKQLTTAISLEAGNQLYAEDPDE